jgi:hypothetical protein
MDAIALPASQITIALPASRRQGNFTFRACSLCRTYGGLYIVSRIARCKGNLRCANGSTGLE